ncbi:MAG: TonB-dependent receptor [Burkholderiales bacterium]|nr:TonB-dependent receptor [Burkholderiales bacterium]
MRAARFNPAPLALAAALCAALSAGTTLPAHAQKAPPTSVQAIVIPAQPLGTALNELARQARLQLSFPAATVAGKTAPAVSGQFTPQQALDRLLAGSGLEADVAGLSVVVRPAGSGTGNTTLPAVQVTASATLAGGVPAVYAGGQTARGGRVGVLGNKDMLDTPFSSTQYTAQLIEDQQAQNLGDVLVNDPSVRNTYSRGAGRDEFNIRGFTLFNYDVSFNGLYGISPRNANAMVGVERVEVLRGPSALLNGMAPAGSVGGAINLVPKRAGIDPLNRLTFSYIGDGQFGTQADVSRRLGQDQEWGVRVNALYRSGDLPVDHAKEDMSAFSLGVDYQGDRVRLEGDIGYQNRLTHARSSLLFLPAAGIPIAPAPEATVNFQPAWSYWKAKELSAMLRAEFDLTPDWMLYGAIGAQQYDFNSLQTVWQLQDAAGNLLGRPYLLNEYVDTRTAEAGLRGQFTTGPLRHQPVLSASTYLSEPGSRRLNGAFAASSIYTPTTQPEPGLSMPSDIPRTASTRLRSVALADTVSTLDDRIQLTLGLRHQQVIAGVYDRSAVTPLAALLLKATNALSFYGNYIEGLGQGPTAPSVGVSNAGAVFPPQKSRQVEAGAKYDFGRFATTFSVYQIERPSSFTEAGVFRVDGEQRNRGVELIGQGEIARGVRLLAGVAYTDATLTRTQNGINDGRTAPATPKFQLNLSGEWDTPFMPGLTLTARGLRTSSQYADVGNTQQIPGWTRYDIGARYRFNSGRVPVTLRAAVENVLDTNYWQSAARDALTIGAPRTLLLSVSADF